MKLFYNTLIILTFFVFIFSPTVRAQTELATQDFTEYQKSNFASSKWDNDVVVGMEAFHQEDYEKASQFLYRAFNKGCRSPIVLFQLALLYEYQESFYSALEYYEMAQKQFKLAHSNHRYNQSFFENYGRALYYSGKKDQAYPILKKIAQKTKSFWILKFMGMLSYEKGDTLNATAYFERAVRTKDVPKDELVYIYSLLGKLYLAKNQSDGALRYYSKVLEIEPNHSEAKSYVQNVQKNHQQEKLINQVQEMME